MKKIIWLTGGSGAGKGQVTDIIRDMGFMVIDADAVSKKILLKGTPGYYEVLKCFGEDILLQSGEINRKLLGEIVFADNKKLKAINEITHKYIKTQISKEIEAINGAVVVDAPLLPTGFIEPDIIIVVTAPEELRIKRIVKRDNIPYDYAKNRLRSQISNEEYIQAADFVIKNDSTLEELRKRVRAVIENMEF